MNDWHKRGFFSLDTETTGLDLTRDRIVTASLVRIEGSKVESLEWLIDPGIDIPKSASDVHGITTERVRAEGRDASESIEEICLLLGEARDSGDPVVIYNAPFDLTILKNEAERYDHEFVVPYVIDPLVIDKGVDRYRRGKRTLTATTQHYGVRLDDAHNATEDALGAARVAWALAERYPDEVQIELPKLVEKQKAWEREQWVSFNSYLKKKGQKTNTDQGWPVRERHSK